MEGKTTEKPAENQANPAQPKPESPAAGNQAPHAQKAEPKIADKAKPSEQTSPNENRAPAAARPESQPMQVSRNVQEQRASPSVQAPEKETPKPPEKTPYQQSGLKLFNRWDTAEVVVSDPGLRGYINLNCMPVPRTGGKYGSGHFTKNKMSIVERFMNRLMIPGHRGKKHKISSGNHAGKVMMLYNTKRESFEIIEKKTKKNPLQVMVGAIENAALLEEVASYRMGGIIARNSVVSSPQRRLDIALRHLTQGIYRTSFRNKRSLASIIADELISANNNDSKSFAVSERNRIEKEAEGAR